jgi:hypothetical protein
LYGNFDDKSLINHFIIDNRARLQSNNLLS